MSEWQPIETAPEWTPVLLYVREQYGEYMEVAEVCTREEGRMKVLADGSELILNATHWMRLPHQPDDLSGRASHNTGSAR